MAPQLVEEPTITARMIARRTCPFDETVFEAFFHIAAVGCWKSVVEEMRQAFAEIDLQPKCCVLGSPEDLEWVRSLGFTVIYHSTDVHEYETPTLQRLWQWCGQNPQGAALYCHTKGASWPLSDIHVAWRRLMVAHVVSPCRRLLPRLQIADIIGVSWEDNPDYPHFCGNFWMARADWVNELDSPLHHRNADGPTFFSYSWDRMSSEMWIGSKGWHYVESVACRNFWLWTDSVLFDIDVPGSDYSELQRLKSRIESYGSDSLHHFGGIFEGGGRIQQNPREFARFLCFLQKQRPGGVEHYLEIGAAAGCSIRAIHDTVGISRATVIDRGEHPGFPLLRENTNAIANVELLEEDSHSEAARKFLDGKSFDLAGIDGDHSYAGVKHDWELTRPHLNSGALVWFHDTHRCEGVQSFLREISQDYEIVFATDMPCTGEHILGIRVVRVP